jgi:hypothetical protein
MDGLYNILLKKANGLSFGFSNCAVQLVPGAANSNMSAHGTVRDDFLVIHEIRPSSVRKLQRNRDLALFDQTAP